MDLCYCTSKACEYNLSPRDLFLALSFGAAAAKSLQSCPTLCDLRDGSPPGSPVPGILQARTLEWVAISFSSAWKWKVKVKSLSRLRLLATPWTAAHQAPPSMGFSRQEYWSDLVFSKCSVRTVSFVNIFLIHLWRKVNSASSYSSILTPLTLLEVWFSFKTSNQMNL